MDPSAFAQVREAINVFVLPSGLPKFPEKVTLFCTLLLQTIRLKPISDMTDCVVN